MNNQETIYSRFHNRALKNKHSTALAYLNDGHYQKITYQELDFLINKLINYFLSLNLKKNDRVAIFSENRWEWPVIDLACNYLGLILVPIHTTYSFKYINYILEKTNPQLIFISQQNLFDNFEKIDFQNIKELRKIISLSNNIRSKLKIKFWSEIMDTFSADLDSSPLLDSKAVMTIIFTSGTTGMPKGVMLTNSNILSNIDNVLQYVPIYASDRFFSFLPLSHILERMGGSIVPLTLGASIYYSRSPKTLIEDIKMAKPSIMISVPRIFERIFDKINDNLRQGSRLKRYFFYRSLKIVSKINAHKRKNKKINKLFYLEIKILENTIFKKIKDIFGSHLRLAISGGSSLDAKIARFFEDVGIKIIEGYGLTETSPIIAVNKIDDYKFSTVGKLLPNLELKINNDKEILVKGSSVMNAYWQDEEANQKSFQGAWFKTGDLGFIDSDGFLNIIGRKKEMIVLSTGKNIIPMNIEQVLNYDRFINQSMVIGLNQKFITALIVPDFKELKIYCQKRDIKYIQDSSILNREVIKKIYKKRIDMILKSFADYEQIGNFYLLDREFDQEHDELTPTLKLKRENIKNNFQNIINKFYKLK